MTPTARTLNHLRKLGYTAGVVERWLPYTRVRVDLFGIGDVVACRSDEPTVLLVQCTSGSNVAARVKKAQASLELLVWLSSGQRFEVWGWRKDASGRWTVRRVEVTADDVGMTTNKETA